VDEDLLRWADRGDGLVLECGSLTRRRATLMYVSSANHRPPGRRCRVRPAPAMPERVNTCAAPVPELWQGAPTTVVDPETATE
jgi:hypothetical protein